MYQEAVEEARSSGDASGLIQELRQLADVLRDAGASDLSPALIAALAFAKERQLEDLATQCGRVAANLVADNDPNRSQLVQSGYVDAAVAVLPLGVKAITASLLNLVVDGHESAAAAISPHLTALLSLDVGEDIQIWIWTIANAIDLDNPSPALQDLLCRPFKSYQTADSKILELAGEVISTTTIQDAEPLLDFVENAEADATVKGNVIRAIVDSDAPNMERMALWLDGREDMQMCALLCYGNVATTESESIAVLDQILPKLLPLLVPESSVQVQHACIGLLRNLTVPAKNKEILHQYDIPTRLQEMGVWTDTRDLVGSVQGGAIGVVKNLCRDNLPNSLQFIRNDEAVEEVLKVIARSDDPPTRYEGTRIFVNALRAGSSDPLIIERCSTEKVIGVLSRMLKESGEYPLLLNEAIIALAILANFGGHEAMSRIRTHVQSDELLKLETDAKIKVNADMLAKLLREKPTAA